ncbi:MAG: hypothetical protein H7Y11_12600 [Armatimonadetes bacterium]|nr:hypothetical protein [Anaerolineae bacterium]
MAKRRTRGNHLAGIFIPVISKYLSTRSRRARWIGRALMGGLVIWSLRSNRRPATDNTPLDSDLEAV